MEENLISLAVFISLCPSTSGGGNVMCVCLYQKSVCQFKVPKVCTVGLYST